MVGGVLGGTRLLADLALPAGPATLLALLAAILVTGALHEDGLADCADALGAHVSRERRLEILKDSRVGTYGALVLVFAVALPWSVLATLDGEHVLRAALVAHVLGRWAMLPLSRALPNARPGGAGALLRAGDLALVGGSITAVAVALGAGGLVAGLVACGAALAVTAGCALVLSRTLGGVTGDGFGATAKLVEVVVYLALVAVWAA